MDESILRTSAGSGKNAVECIGIFAEKGIVLCVFGGEQPHIGAVALAIPRPSLKDQTKLSATSSILTVVGHKEDELVKSLSEETARKLNLTTVVVAGLHVEKASGQDIKSLRENAIKATEETVNKLVRRQK